jgi:hypothetical protein
MRPNSSMQACTCSIALARLQHQPLCHMQDSCLTCLSGMEHLQQRILNSTKRLSQLPLRPHLSQPFRLTAHGASLQPRTPERLRPHSPGQPCIQQCQQTPKTKHAAATAFAAQSMPLLACVSATHPGDKLALSKSTVHQPAGCQSRRSQWSGSWQ